MSLLDVGGLWKDYGGEPVLRGVDLEVPAGSLTAVLGHSGCGKTTLLRVIAGFERAQRGRVTLGERLLEGDGTHVAPERRSVGYVAQEGALFPHLDVASNVAFGLPRRERRSPSVTGLLEMTGIDALAARMPHELSGGEQQRVALARALALRPSLLLLDEPFSSLDASLRTQLREEVQRLLNAQGVTAVLVTHDQEEALSLAASVAVLRDGRIVQHGDPVELYEQPRDDELARFVGSANVLDGVLDGDSAHTALGRLALSEPAPTSGAANVRVMLRPEQLEVFAGESAQGARGVQGTVRECRYYGHDALLGIELLESDGGGRLLLARVDGTAALAPGTPVTMTAQGAARLLAPDAD